MQWFESSLACHELIIVKVESFLRLVVSDCVYIRAWSQYFPEIHMPNHFLCVCRRRQFCRQPATASRRLFLSTWGSVGSFIASVPGLLPLTTWRRFLLIAFKTNQKKNHGRENFADATEAYQQGSNCEQDQTRGFVYREEVRQGYFEKDDQHDFIKKTDFITDGLNLISYLLGGICPKSDVNSDLFQSGAHLKPSNRAVFASPRLTHSSVPLVLGVLTLLVTRGVSPMSFFLARIICHESQI